MELVNLEDKQYRLKKAVELVKEKYDYILIDCALICLDYTDNSNYVMQFRVGMTKNGFAAERTDKFMDMFYRFDNHAQSESFRLYLDNENKEFSRIANIILEMPVASVL